MVVKIRQWNYLHTSFTVFVVLLLGAIVAGTARAEMINIGSADLSRLLQDKVAVIDVRTAEEWHETGVVPDSHLLTFFDHLGRFDAQGWYEQFSKIADPETPAILICHSGVRSKVIAYWLSKSAGYSTIYNVADGIEGWQAANGETIPPSL